MKKILLIILYSFYTQSFSCCPWLFCKKRSVVLGDAVELTPASPDISLATVVQIASPRNIFSFKTDNRSTLDKNVELYDGITKRQLKESIVKACGYADYQNKGYSVRIYNGGLQVGLVSVDRSDDTLVRSEDIKKILKFEDALVIIEPL